jgi:sugar lactone lactonase YvrE/4-amino-4-deoxy-L-arabinose transferase-like glycosyltransferase
MESQSETTSTHSWLDTPVFAKLPFLNIETFIVILVLLLALVSRFADLGLRVQAHDEINHVIPSYELAHGQGYRHDPVTHGPLQFHLIALSYTLFGSNDFTSRIPSAIFSIATVAVVLFGFRRYLGRVGSLIAGALFLISPYMLFYGRYTRNESFVALFGVLTLLGVLRYLEKGEKKYLFLITIVTALQFSTKETAYIYTAQLLIFLAFLFMDRITRAAWPSVTQRNRFLILLSAALLLLLSVLGLSGWNSLVVKSQGEAAALPFVPAFEVIGFVLAAAAGVYAILILIRSLGWETIRHERAFEMLILVIAMILPLLTAFPVKMIGSVLGLGWDPLDYSTAGLLRTGTFLFLMVFASVGLGFAWNFKLWLANFAAFYTVFTVLYTTVFTNGLGFFTGIVGSLGYWLAQQGVVRGDQPIYYYVLTQLPVYEFLALFGMLLAIYFAVRYHKFAHLPTDCPARVGPAAEPVSTETGNVIEAEGATSLHPLPVMALLTFWAVSALGAYTLAGEKMPWLTVHIALPILLAAGWGFGFLVDSTKWDKLKEHKAWVSLLLIPVVITSLGAVLASVLGANPPFQGNELEQLRATSNFVFGLAAFILSSWGTLHFLGEWTSNEILRVFASFLAVFFTILTIRASFAANYINYENGKEFLVYAHGADGPKQILAQVEEISRRTVGGKNIQVAYDNDAQYPFWWYFVDYPNKRYFTKDDITRDLRDYPVIIAGESSMPQLDALTKDTHISYEYIRLLWPNMDYFNLTWDRVWGALSSPQYRAGLFDIWLNRDYTLYAQAAGSETMTVENWEPSEKIRLYIRKDIVSQIWNYGAAPTIAAETETDPYQAGMLTLAPDAAIGQSGSEPGQLQAPRGMAMAADGSLYVADSRNQRIQHFAADGTLISAWGSFGETTSTETAAGGTFNEPWDVAVGPDGSVYVTDTWNHRIQKFTAEGQFVTTWGYFGQAETSDAFWGPRALAFDSRGYLYVTDTGNKRVAVFTQDGQFVTQFGSTGYEPGQFDEQVGIAINAEDQIFVADTWNQRIQVLQLDPATNEMSVVRTWDISGWYGQSLDNKPFIDVDNQGHVFITDPEGYRVLEFTEEGEFVRGWGDYSPSTDGFGLASGVVCDGEGGVWVSDGANNVLLHFTLPADTTISD